MVSVSAFFSSRRRHTGVELHRGAPYDRAIRAHSFTAFAYNCMATRNKKRKANSAVGKIFARCEFNEGRDKAFSSVLVLHLDKDQPT